MPAGVYLLVRIVGEHHWPGFMVLRFSRILGGTAILICWMVAVVTAVASFSIYRRKRKPWYVWVNLIINGTGLAMTVLLIVLILVIMNTGFE